MWNARYVAGICNANSYGQHSNCHLLRSLGLGWLDHQTAEQDVICQSNQIMTILQTMSAILLCSLGPAVNTLSCPARCSSGDSIKYYATWWNQLVNGCSRKLTLEKLQKRIMVYLDEGFMIFFVVFNCCLGCCMNLLPHPVAMCFVVPALTAILITDQPVLSADFPWKRYIST